MRWLKQLLRGWLFKVEWQDRSVPTPVEEKIWATDGETVWTIWGQGKPIEEGAVNVKFWARRIVPDPPPPTQGRMRLGHIFPTRLKYKEQA